MNMIPLLEILIANLIWGFGFVATIWSLESLSWSQIFLYRFLLAGITGLLIYIIFNRKFLKTYIETSFIPSIFLCLEIGFQIYALQFTTATEGGFLFVMYIIFIPLIEYVLFKKILKPKQFLWIVMGLIGSALMVKNGKMSLDKGELAMLGSAFFAGLHVISIDRTNKLELNPFYLNTFQLLWGILFSLPIYFFIDHNLQGFTYPKALVGFLCLAFGSTLLAYFLQIKAQLKISPAMISILFLMESAFSAVFAFILLGDRISVNQWIGALVISLSAVAVSIDFFKSEK